MITSDTKHDQQCKTLRATGCWPTGISTAKATVEHLRPNLPKMLPQRSLGHTEQRPRHIVSGRPACERWGRRM